MRETFVGKPVLAIAKSGPEMAQVGSDVTYNIVVSNTGTAVAREVVVTDTIPDGLSHSSGQSQLSSKSVISAQISPKPFR